MSTNENQPENNILSMVRKRTTAAPTKSLEKIERYWNVVRANRLVPSRCEIDPRGLEGVLGNCFILERITGGLARFRIAGAHINELVGLELRQMPISALFSPQSRELLSDAMVAVFEEPAIVRLRLESRGGFGRERLEGEMILLPLRSDMGQVDRVLGGIMMHGKVGRTPRRFEILGQSRQSIVGFAGPQSTPANDVPHRPAPLVKSLAPVQGEAERPRTPRAPVAPVAPVPAAPAALIERGHLRLVVDNG
ncbi:MAG: PAS domain-containing protein [Silicimonas sp.]|nr:PAS domain-containing protein [Silicimonas sp.]